MKEMIELKHDWTRHETQGEGAIGAVNMEPSFQTQPCYKLLFIYSHVAIPGKIAGRWIGGKTVSFIYTNWQVKNALKTRILKNPWLLNRSSHSQMFLKISVLKNIRNLTGKHQCLSLFLIKLQACGQTHSNNLFATAEHHWWLLQYSSVTLAVVTSVF